MNANYNNKENIYSNNINDNINKNNMKNNNVNNNMDNKIISVPPKKRKKKKKNTHPPTNIININNISNRNEQMNNSNSINKNLLGRNKHKYLSHVVSNDLLRNSNEERILNENNNNNIKGIKIKNNINIKKEDKNNKREENIDNQKFQLTENEFIDYMKKPPDEMKYEEALSADKRKFGTLYLNILIQKQPILNIIFDDEKFRSRILKIIIHILSIDLYLVINGLFFSESYIDEIYLSKKEEKFFSFIPRSISRIIYTSVVTVIVNFLINCILINEDKIKSTILREKKDITIMRGEIGIILYRMEKNIKIFIFVNFIIMLLSWYYISCFNHAYFYTKKEWIKSSIFILILAEIFPFLYALIIAVLRRISLSCKSEQIYKISSSL